MRASMGSALIAALAGMMFGGCPSCSDPNQSSGAVSTDSATNDSDAGVTAETATDAASDSTLPDSLDEGLDDAAPSFFRGEWDPIPGGPAECGAPIARDAAASVGPLTFEPCPSGTPGCRRLVIDWTDEKGSVLEVPDTEPVRLVRGKPVLAYTRRDVVEFWKLRRSIKVVQPLDGAAVFAARTDLTLPTFCSFFVRAGEYGVVMSGVTSAENSPVVLAWAPWDHLDSLRARVVPKSDLGALYSQRVAVSAQHLFQETRTPTKLAIFDLVAGGSHTIATDRVENPRAMVDGAFAHAYTGITYERVDGSGVLVVTPESGRAVSWFAIDRTDNRLTWIESDRPDLDFLNPVIWESLLSSDPSKIVRHRVGALPLDEGLHDGGRGTVANAGVVLSVTGPKHARITRLSDGRAWTIDAEPEVRFVSPIWVDADEAWILTTDAALVGVNPSGIQRVRRDGLGAGS